MDDNSKQYYQELAEQIESGEYFREARNWYLNKYMFQFIERSYLILVIIGFIILLLLVNHYNNAIKPIKKSLPIQVNISSAADFAARIKYLGKANKQFDINEVYIRYFSGRFVKAIESYDYRNDFKQLRINKNLIESLATNDIVGYYMDKISIRNSDSFIMKYRKKVSRIIDIDNTKIEIAPYNDPKDLTDSFDENTDDGDKTKEIKKYLVTANFVATETTKEGNQVKENWQAKIILSFQTIKYNYKVKDFSPLNFKVSNYESKKIN